MDMQGKIHQGRNIKRFREMLGIKQEALAAELGEEWTQKKISVMEQKASIETDLLKQVAAVLNVPEEAIRSFCEESAVNCIKTFYDSSRGNFTCCCTFNQVDKILRLYDEKVALLERLLESEKEKVALLTEKKFRLLYLEN